MTIIRPAEQRRGVSPATSVYGSSFVRIVHRVLAAAYARLPKEGLSKMEEPSITGLLVSRMRSFLEDPAAPRWAGRLAVHDDPPINLDGLQGKRRPRIDIEVESVTAGRRPRFQFEAKRLNGTQGVSAYVGSDGLGCYVSEKYARDHVAAGMLAYIQEGDASAWMIKIEASLSADRSTHGLAKSGPIWETFSSPDHTLPSYRSVHKRSTSPIVIFHTFMQCG
jgi:hypothetical protein